MALPGSGAISTAQIRAEIGGSGSIVIPSAEVRTLTGVGSGPIVLPDDFWGANGAGSSDQTPAAMNWGNLAGSGAQTNANQTVSSIDVPILLRAAFSSLSGSGTGEQTVYVNDVLVDTVTPVLGGSTSEFLVESGDTVHFGAQTYEANRTWTTTITNLSNAGAAVDTFTNTMTF
jgi:hypothetical protein